MIEHVIDFLVAVITGWLASIEWRLRMVTKEGQDKPSRKDVVEIIDLKQESLKTMQKQIQEDLHRLENKIDKLIEKS